MKTLKQERIKTKNLQEANQKNGNSNFSLPISTLRNLKNKKKQQLEVCLQKEVEMEASNGFERYSFIHQALPEVNFSEIDTSCQFLGKRLSAPILISPLVGGVKEAARINRCLAAAAQKIGLAMGVGSMRIALATKAKEVIESFKVRRVAPGILLFANLGAIQFNYGFGPKEAKEAVAMIKADGLVLHLNPLQEVFQRGGQTNFKGLLAKIKKLIKSVSFPIIVKEVGGGISYQVARKLYNIGVKIVDTAGAGGTSWAEIENQISNIKNQNDKSKIKNLGETFKNWGIPTAESLVECKKVKGLKVICSGGIRNGIEIAKAIALGADLVGVGLPLLKAAQKSEKEVEKLLRQLILELKITMFCVGAKNIEGLRKAKIVNSD